MGPADVVRHVAAGPAINGTRQLGWYLVTGKSPDKGYLVFVNPAG